MNNAVFGKIMENVRNHVDNKMERYGAEAMIAKFHSRSAFANLIAVEMRKLEIKFDKSIYVGMCILDISKICLYEFHHVIDVSRQIQDHVHWHGQSHLPYRMRCLQEYETRYR